LPLTFDPDENSRVGKTDVVFRNARVDHVIRFAGRRDCQQAPVGYDARVCKSHVNRERLYEICERIESYPADDWNRPTERVAY